MWPGTASAAAAHTCPAQHAFTNTVHHTLNHLCRRRPGWTGGTASPSSQILVGCLIRPCRRACQDQASATHSQHSVVKLVTSGEPCGVPSNPCVASCKPLRQAQRRAVSGRTMPTLCVLALCGWLFVCSTETSNLYLLAANLHAWLAKHPDVEHCRKCQWHGAAWLRLVAGACTIWGP